MQIYDKKSKKRIQDAENFAKELAKREIAFLDAIKKDE